MRKRIKYIVIIMIIMMGVSYANASEFEINANQSAAEGRLLISRQNVSAGIGVLYNDDKYTIGSAILSFVNTRLIEKLKFSIGFKGLMGTVKKRSGDVDLSAAGFLLSMGYDIPKLEIYYNMPLDFEFLAELCLAPSPLCFGDSDGYVELKTGLGLHVLGEKKGTLIVGYRTMETRFDETFNNWKMSDSAVFFGYRFTF